MEAIQPTTLLSPPELERHVRARAGCRVRGLRVEVHPGRVVLRGRADSYHVKQLAQEGVLGLLPGTRLENAIAVAGSEAP